MCDYWRLFMNYFKTCSLSKEIIDNYHISNADLNSFYEFLNQHDYFNKICNDHLFFLNNRPEIVEEWFYFLQQHKPNQNETKEKTYGNTIFRATFGDTYNLQQIANTPLYYSKGSNGTGLYAATDDIFGKSYIKTHLLKRFRDFDQKTGNIIKIGIDENATVMSKIDIHKAQKRFVEEISQMNINGDSKNIFKMFLSSDVSLSAILLGADIMFMPNGHVIILNKDALIFPKEKEDFQNCTLKIDLEKFRAKDKDEVQRVDEFLQPE